jgi:putative glutamine amidotransferase
MRKPLIGITCGRYLDPRGEVLVGTRPAYVRAVEQAGGMPILLPPNLTEESLRDVFAYLDGIILSGGADIDPVRYGFANGGLSRGVDSGRDTLEIAIARWSVTTDKPILGICRGCQIMNVALGGTLFQDIPSERPSDVDHDQWGKLPRSGTIHQVTIKPDTRLADALGEGGTFHVNSLHHQALRDIPTRLHVSAQSEDGLPEGIELPDARFYVAVQWHPEELTAEGNDHDETTTETMRHLFETFVEAARPN